MTIWTAGSTSLNASGDYKDGISLGQWTADGSTDNNKPNDAAVNPCRGPNGFRYFQMDTYTPRGPDPFPNFNSRY